MKHGYETMCVRLGMALIMVAVCCASGTWAAEAPPDPGTYMYDAGPAALAPNSVEVQARKGWTRLAEDDTAHVFRGAAVLANDRLAAVLPACGDTAWYYGLGLGHKLVGGAITLRLGPDGRTPGPGVWKIAENNPGAVMLEATFQRPSVPAVKIRYRLTAGQPMLELHTEPSEIAVSVVCDAQVVVVPDFFGDDMLTFPPRTSRGESEPIPAENYVLGLDPPGGTMTMCVWKARNRMVDSAPHGWTIGPVPAGADSTLWVAMMEADGICHTEYVTAAPHDDAGHTETTLGWKPPFAAKWRAVIDDRPSRIPRSWYFRQTDDKSDVADLEKCPCRLDASGATIVTDLLPASWAKWEGHLLVTYPIDRSRATPLNVFCPIDILRATLGVGPCQYILQTEGLASETNPTPDNVMTWVEKQFSKKKQKKEADEIRRLLDEMVGHMRHAEARLDRYAGLAKIVATSLAAETTAPGLPGLRDTLAYFPSALAPVSAAVRPSAQARKLADDVASLIDRDDAAAECRRLGREIRRQGALQDAALARCRLAARLLRAQAGTLDGGHGASVQRIQQEINQVLETK